MRERRLTVLQGFYPGNPDTVVLGFRNNGQRPFVFKQIAGSLRYEMDFNYILENVCCLPAPPLASPLFLLASLPGSLPPRLALPWC